MSNLREMMDTLLLEDVLDREGQDYKFGHGSSGEQLNIHECPFCGGSEWKVYANRDTGLGNCFHGSCGQTFNVFTFTEALIDRSGRETFQYLERLAKDMGWRPKKRVQIETEVEDNADWSLPESYQLPTEDGQTLKYLMERRVDQDMAAYFKLRYCVDAWYNYEKPDGEPGGMNFGERVLIPVYDLDGTMVTFQGRDLTGESDRKYLFPPGLPGTGRFLYNGQNVVGKKSIIANEGAFDVFRTFLNIKDTEFDHMGVVGTFGIHLSKGTDGNDQKHQLLRLKSHGLEEVILFWDGEEIAFRKALKSAMEIKKLGLKVRVARPPDGKDPGDLSVSETLKALRDAVEVTRMTALQMRLG